MRGALNVMLFVPFDQYIVAASGGHHGLAVAIAGKLLGVSATLCVPRTAPEGTVRRVEVTGTRLVLHGGWCRPRWPQDGRYSPSSKARYEKYLPEPAGSYGEEAPPHGSRSLRACPRSARAPGGFRHPPGGRN
ncbi:pyridoxal-phosphate dependent enzyme [Streptomyces glaucescens]|uniref:pyridoxal-phosphate dependent enzyme n=1 Tax=Streptomyces glaucescens TaxID=1907 RepID=UPI003BB5E0AE